MINDLFELLHFNLQNSIGTFKDKEDDLPGVNVHQQQVNDALRATCNELKEGSDKWKELCSSARVNQVNMFGNYFKILLPKL